MEHARERGFVFEAGFGLGADPSGPIEWAKVPPLHIANCEMLPASGRAPSRKLAPDLPDWMDNEPRNLGFAYSDDVSALKLAPDKNPKGQIKVGL